ncbi:uncharacterized protein LOC134525736 [Chroicocephalus ridibundus]|uniref:uncharacterized protein LOC134525736 n=1 Tax=Chroicocephalus ridibundus TaxID=1192867 RepID=UPI002FDED620
MLLSSGHSTAGLGRRGDTVLDIVTAQHSGASGAPGESPAHGRVSCSVLGAPLPPEPALGPRQSTPGRNRHKSCRPPLSASPSSAAAVLVLSGRREPRLSSADQTRLKFDRPVEKHGVTSRRDTGPPIHLRDNRESFGVGDSELEQKQVSKCFAKTELHLCCQVPIARGMLRSGGCSSDGCPAVMRIYWCLRDPVLGAGCCGALGRGAHLCLVRDPPACGPGAAQHPHAEPGTASPSALRPVHRARPVPAQRT